MHAWVEAGSKPMDGPEDQSPKMGIVELCCTALLEVFAGFNDRVNGVCKALIRGVEHYLSSVLDPCKKDPTLWGLYEGLLLSAKSHNAKTQC